MEYRVEYNITESVWYAMKASYGRATKAKVVLDSMNIENYMPLRYEKVKVRGRNKIISSAAIANLIFIRSALTQLEEAKHRINYLHNMLTRSVEQSSVLVPIVISDRDMDHFMQVAAFAKEKINYIDTELNPLSKGCKVRVSSGEFKGYEGILIRPKGSRSRKVVLDVNGVLSVEIPSVDIELLEIID